MKILYLFVMLLAFTAAGCSKKTTGSAAAGVLYTGVVLHAICCQDVIQTIGPDQLGQASWIDSGDAARPVYSHVFTVANPCQFGNHVAGDTIKFKVIPQEVQNCACCMMYIPTPSTTYPIQVVN
jgi:hypothetical protein